MYSTFLLLTLLTSLATAAPIPSDSTVIKPSLVSRNLQDLDGYGIHAAKTNEDQIDERIGSPSKRAPEFTTHQLKFTDAVNGQEISDDVMDQYGNSILVEGLGTRNKRSVNGLSKTVFEWAKSAAKSSVEKHARDTGREAASRNTLSANGDGASPKSRTCRMSDTGANRGGRGNVETQSNEVSTQGGANRAQDGGNNNGAQRGGHTANVDGSYNGFLFGQAVRFPHR